MSGQVGDHIVVDSERVGKAARVGEILEVHQSGDRLSYTVRWEDGHETDFRPAAGSARIIPAQERSPHEPAGT